MRRRTIYRFIWVVSLLVVFSLGCGLVTQIKGLKSTAEVAGTAVESGRELLDTVQAIATQVDVSGVKVTLLAAATEVGESGFKETLQAISTQVEDSDFRETVQAAATQIFIPPEDIPEDIPVMDGEKNAFVGSSQAISYFIDADVGLVLEFYQREMPARGWSKIDYGTMVTDVSAELHYEKEDRKATVVISEVPVLGQVTVVITIEG